MHESWARAMCEIRLMPVYIVAYGLYTHKTCAHTKVKKEEDDEKEEESL